MNNEGNPRDVVGEVEYIGEKDYSTFPIMVRWRVDLSNSYKEEDLELVNGEQEEELSQEEIKERELSEVYLGQYKQKKFYDDSAAYPVNVYFPIIEEMTFGRRLLEVDSLDLGISKSAAVS